MSPDEVIAEVERLGGPRISRRTLLLWEQEELIPPATRGSHGQGRGRFSDYPPETPQEAFAAAKLLRNGVPYTGELPWKRVKLTLGDVRNARKVGRALLQGAIPLKDYADCRVERIWERVSDAYRIVISDIEADIGKARTELLRDKGEEHRILRTSSGAAFRAYRWLSTEAFYINMDIEPDEFVAQVLRLAREIHALALARSLLHGFQWAAMVFSINHGIVPRVEVWEAKDHSFWACLVPPLREGPNEVVRFGKQPEGAPRLQGPVLDIPL